MPLLLSAYENQKIKIYIVEDYMLTRITYRHTLPKYNSNLEIIKDFETAESCIEALKNENADVVLMDLGLPGMNGIDATHIVRRMNPDIKIIILTSHDSDDEVLASLTAGANAYALKDITPETLATVIESVNKGAFWLDPRIARIALNLFSRLKALNMDEMYGESFKLTSRENEVLQMIVDGKSNTEIAKQMIISHNTVKAHVGNILEKLAVSDRVQAAVKAVKITIMKN